MCQNSDLDDLYLETPASELLNATEAALVADFRGEQKGRLEAAVAADAARGTGVVKSREERMTGVVESLLHELYAADAKVAAEGAAGDVTVDLIEVDVRPELVAAALIADGCILNPPN